MEDTCHLEPTDKKGYIKELGTILVKEHGKKKFYTPKEVKKAHRQSSWSYVDFSCWAMSVFSSHSDFDTYHKETGEVCDYSEMKIEMMKGLSTTNSGSRPDTSEPDIDASWLDFENLDGGILEGIGEFFSALLENVDFSL